MTEKVENWWSRDNYIVFSDSLMHLLSSNYILLQIPRGHYRMNNGELIANAKVRLIFYAIHIAKTRTVYRAIHVRNAFERYLTVLTPTHFPYRIEFKTVDIFLYNILIIDDRDLYSTIHLCKPTDKPLIVHLIHPRSMIAPLRFTPSLYA